MYYRSGLFAFIIVTFFVSLFYFVTTISLFTDYVKAAGGVNVFDFTNPGDYTFDSGILVVNDQVQLDTEAVLPTQWENSISGTESMYMYQIGYRVKQDSQGNIYVIGNIGNQTTGNDWVIEKYNGNTGSLLWRDEFFVENSYVSDEPYNMVIDGNDDVIVVGYAYHTGTDFDAQVVKYAGAGDGMGGANRLWTYSKSGNHSVFSSDWFIDVAVDNNNDVFVVGTARNNGTGDDWIVQKLNGVTGAFIWEDIFDNASAESAITVIVDSNGDVIVSGHRGFSSNGWLTRKYDGFDGSLLWSKTYYVARGQAHRLALDSQDNVIVAGYTGSTANMAVVKADSVTGNVIWSYVMTSIGGHSTTVDVIVDSNDDVYVGGYYDNGSEDVTRVFKLSANGDGLGNGDLLWFTDFPEISWFWDEDLQRMLAFDSNEDIIVGSVVRNVNWLSRWFIAKIDHTNGDIVFEFTVPGNFVGAWEDDEILFDILVDANDNIVATGFRTEISGDKQEIHTIKFESSPSFQYLSIPLSFTNNDAYKANFPISAVKEDTGVSHQGSIEYQLSPDGGSTYYYYDAGWQVAGNDGYPTETTKSEDFDFSSSPFSEPTNIMFKAYLKSNGIQPIELNNICFETATSNSTTWQFANETNYTAQASTISNGEISLNDDAYANTNIIFRSIGATGQFEFIGTDKDGNVYFMLNTDPVHIQKYTIEGHFLWEFISADPLLAASGGHRFFVDEDGNVYGGLRLATNSPNFRHNRIFKLPPNGGTPTTPPTPTWIITKSHASTSSMAVQQIRVDNDGYVVVLFTYDSGFIARDRIRVAKLDPDTGNDAPSWASNVLPSCLGSSSYGYSHPRVGFDSNNDLFIIAHRRNASTNNNHAVACKLSGVNAFQLGSTWHNEGSIGTNKTTGHAIVMDSNNEVYVGLTYLFTGGGGAYLFI